MSFADNNETCLEIVNKVLVRMGLSTVSALDANKLSIMACGLINDVLDDIGDHGNGRWPFVYQEIQTLVTANSQTIKLDDEIRILEEVAVSGQISPLQVTTIEDYRRLRRTNARGVPRFFAVTHVSGVAVTIGFHPRPTVNTTCQVASYMKIPTVHPDLGEEATTFPFPSTMVTQGLYAYMLLEESGGSHTQESQSAMALYSKMKTETYNRYVGDTGTDVYLVPTGW